MLPSLHFDGRVITSDEIERIEAVSDPGWLTAMKSQ
jgi:hypothetical protein